VLALSEGFMILACTVFVWLRNATNGRTKGRTPLRSRVKMNGWLT